MTDLLIHLQNWTDQKKFIGYDNRLFYELVQAYIQQFNSSKNNLENNSIFKIILAEKEPDKFLAIFLACIITKTLVFLANPDWQESEWQQVFELVEPDLIFGLDQDFSINNTFIKKTFLVNNEYLNQSLVMIPTGGTSGKIKFAIHTWSTLTASYQGLQEYFNLEEINSFCLLPLYHVSGLMQFVRSFLSLGELIVLPYASFKKNPILAFEYQSFFISLVPKQLHFFLENYPDWLTQFPIVLLGGEKASLNLLARAREKKIKLALTYGMTETASQIVTLKPQNFIYQNNNTVGKVLPHAQMIICDGQGQELSNHQTGIIAIKAKSLFLGYYPDFNNSNIFLTDDLGYFDEQNYLHIIGRNSQKIITGGENVFPLEIETAILETQLVKDVVVIGVLDEQWGEVVTAIYISPSNNFDLEKLKIILKKQLSAYKCPKHWLAIDQIPRTTIGKINYQCLKQYASSQVRS
jgi:O-succinylbenzoic acid--CoA ligase